eukprot:gene20399-26470_t
MFLSLLLTLNIFNIVNGYTEKALLDQIIDLPENDPANDPLVFWTNGGPGCSGLIGFMTEQGPFRPLADNTLKLNDYAWNKVANMVFIEQPTGVGFSYSEDESDYKMNDQKAASDNYAIIQEFLLRFPEYASNPLYTTAESYGGHYMPEIALFIVNQNANPTTQYTTTINYKGFAVGNPFTDHNSEYPAMFYTYWGHQLIAKPTWDTYQSACNKKIKTQINITECELLEIKMGTEVGNLNPYAVDYPVCTADSKLSNNKKGNLAQLTWTLNYMLPDYMKEVLMPTTQEDYEPCADNYMVTYLNTLEVKQALHVDTSITWEECSSSLRYNTADRLIPMQPIYQQLLAADAGLSLLVYSGDNDAVCGTIGTQEWIWDLGYTPVTTWETWTYNGQTAGYNTKFNITTGTDNKLSFLTVRRAGHEVPTYVPEEALDLFSKYLSGYWF